jgi:hypothetical protein
MCEVAYQLMLIEVSPGAFHVHQFFGGKFSANPVEGGRAGFDVRGGPYLKHSGEVVAVQAVQGRPSFGTSGGSPRWRCWFFLRMLVEDLLLGHEPILLGLAVLTAAFFV